LSDYFEALKNVNNGNYGAAEQIFRGLVGQKPDDTNYLVHLAASILINGRDTMVEQNKVAGRMTPELRESFAEAERMLSRVIDLLSSKESKRRLVGAHINRSFARIMLGKQKGAIEDCEEALRVAPETKDAHLNKSKAEIELGAYFEALQSLQRYVELGGSTDFVIRDLALCYFRTGQITNAKDLLHGYLDRELVSEDITLAGLAVHVYDLACPR